MLTEAQQAQLREEELYRKSVRDELAPKPPSFRNALTSVDTIKWAIVTLAIPLTLAIYGGIDTANHKADLQNERAIADSRRDVDQLTALLPALAAHDEDQRKIALAVLERLKDASKAVDAIYVQVKAQAEAKRKSADPEQRAQGAATTEVLLSASVNAPLAPPAPTAPVADQANQVAITQSPAQPVVRDKTFIYTQIYGERQRAEADRLSAAFRAHGIPVLGVQNVGKDAVGNQLAFAQRGPIDIRFYHPEDKASALSLAPIIRSVSPSYGEPTVHDLSKRAAKARSGTLEVWYPCALRGQVCPAGGGG
jgi:hypothetical protein